MMTHDDSENIDQMLPFECCGVDEDTILVPALAVRKICQPLRLKKIPRKCSKILSCTTIAMADVKRKRASTRRTRTGCITCKIRHVKCDEEKPECRQCTSTGRKCDRYQPSEQELQKLEEQHRERLRHNSARLISAISSDHTLTLRPGTKREQEYTHLFCTRTTKVLSGIISSEFWDYFLPQLSQSNAAVRHAAAAISGVHEGYLRDGVFRDHSQGKPPGGSNESFVLEQYNKAIKALMGYLSQSEPPSDLALIVCCLFGCLEILKTNNTQAMNHIEAGLRILSQREQTRNSHDQIDRRTIISTNIDKDISYLFSRLKIQLSLFGRPPTQFDPLHNVTTQDYVLSPPQFTTIAHAKDRLDILMSKALAFITAVKAQTHGSSVQELQKQQQRILGELDEWSTAFKNLLNRPKEQIGETDPRSRILLQLHHQISRLWLETSLLPSTLMFDDYDADFEAIVSYAAEMLVLGQKSPEPFFLEMGAIPSLYWTALRCRNSVIRWKAVDILSSCTTKEGMWGAPRQAKVAAFAVSLEEESVSHLPRELRFVEEKYRLEDVWMPDELPKSTFQVILVSKAEGSGGLNFRAIEMSMN